jgi:5-methylcytosine-specific restriction endonuclease McrA
MSRCLAVNASFEPLAPVPVQRALRLVLQGKAEVVLGDDDRPVRSAGRAYTRPAVIRLTKFVKVPRVFRRRVTNTFLFARDGRCGYCLRTADQLRPREAFTRDHIVPRSKGGADVWTNVVTACSSCNNRKGDRSLAEAARLGMRLQLVPTEPHLVHLTWNVRRMTEAQRRWVTLVYGEAYLAALG